MKCHIPGLNVKILGRTIHALARFGDELYLESLPDCLLLQTLNAAESAYAMLKFQKAFFVHFNHNYYATNDNDGLKCKISMKSALSVFKSPTQMEKQVETLEIKLDPDSCKLVFQLRCKHGIVKTHFVSILDCKAMDAVYTKDMVPNRITAHYRVLSDAISNFQTSEEQITLDVTPQAVLIRNYIDDNADFSRVIRTQLCIKAAEFDLFTIGADTNITFTIKELRAILTFAENLNLPIHIHFETTGRPAVFIVHNSTTFEANFVMATVKPDMGTQANSTQSTNFKETVNQSKRTHTQIAGQSDSSVKKKPHLEVSKEIAECLDEDSHLFDFEMPTENEIETMRAQRSSKIDLNMSRAVRSIASNATVNTILPSSSYKGQMLGDENKIGESFADLEDIPGSPASKAKIRTVFNRCFEMTFDPSIFHKVVLANNSDSE